MIGNLVLHDNIVEGTVRSEMYRVTTVVINVAWFEQGERIFPCGDGCDYHLIGEDEERVRKFIKKGKVKS